MVMLRTAVGRHMRDDIRHFPARPLTPDEHALLAEWLANAGDIASAYVSSRVDDDPVLYRRIVIIPKLDRGPSHLIHAPPARAIWLVFSLQGKQGIKRFRTLRDALNSVRPVLPDAGVDAKKNI